MSRLIVIAIGGNSLIQDVNHVSVEEQYNACRATCRHIVKLLKPGHRFLITHGNGPQVGFILRRGELARKELHMVPLDSCVADTQGAIGYHIQMAILNEMREQGIKGNVVTVVTQVVVGGEPSLRNPTKPIGSFMTKKEAIRHRREDGWSVVSDAGRGYRRVVSSPMPEEIVELEAVKVLLEKEMIVIAAGGGGIPVVREKNGNLKGVEAVIDKDFTSALLAKSLNADLFIISTAVEKVFLDFGRKNQKGLGKIPVSELRKYAREGQFAEGSMLPKVNALIDFVEATGNPGIITGPERLSEAIEGKAGTIVIPARERI